MHKMWTTLAKIWIMALALLGCQIMNHHKQHDPYLNMDKNDTRKAFLPNETPPPLMPSIQKAPLKPTVFPTSFPPSAAKKISLTTTESVPLKDVFHTIAKQSDLTISVDPAVKGGILYHAHERSAEEVIKDLCEASGLRYRLKKGLIKIEIDAPYLKTYAIQYLALTRKNESRISIATDVFTSIDQKNQHVDNGSNTLVTSESQNDFWQELQQNIDSILKTYGPSASFSFHRQGGLLSITAPELCHQEIVTYLSMLDTAMTSQVLIEAKIIEVQLKEEFKSGINWNSLKGDFVIQSPLGEITRPGPFDPAASPPRDVFTIGGAGRHLTGLISFLNTFGTVRTLSNPRLMVMNNQSAILKVATNEVFFRIDYSREYGFESRRDRENVSSEIHTVPIGLVMMVHPAINTEMQSIIMTLRPTISRVVEQKGRPRRLYCIKADAKISYPTSASTRI